MAIKSTTSIALFLSFNVLLFTLVSGCPSCHKPKPKPPPACPPTPSKPTPPTTPKTPPTTPPKTPPTTPPKTPPSTPPTTPPKEEKCPIDTLKLGACADVLGGLLNLNLGSQPVEPCCSLLSGIADVDAAVCLCTALKANVLGINLNVPISLSLLLNVCSKEAPSDFQCS